MSLPAGKRSTYLTVWRDASTIPSSTADTGQMVETSVKVCNVWGELKAAIPASNAVAVKGQTEEWGGYHVNVNAKYIVTIPYTPDIEATDYFTALFRGTTYRYNIAGAALFNGNDMIFAVSLVA